jgi:hypothetical protein
MMAEISVAGVLGELFGAIEEKVFKYRDQSTAK